MRTSSYAKLFTRQIGSFVAMTSNADGLVKAELRKEDFLPLSPPFCLLCTEESCCCMVVLVLVGGYGNVFYGLYVLFAILLIHQEEMLMLLLLLPACSHFSQDLQPF